MTFAPTQFLLVLLAGAFLVFFVQYFWKRRRLYRLSANIPGPRGLPLVGTGYLFLFGDAAVIAKNVINVFNDYPDLGCGWFGQDLFYFVSRPEYVETVLNHPGCFEKTDLYKYVKNMIGDGLISGPVHIWKRHRKIIAPAFNQKILNSFQENVHEQCEMLVEVLRNECGNGKEGMTKVDVCRHVTNCALDVVCETIVGVKVDAQKNRGDYSHIFDRLMEVIYLRMYRLWYHCDFIFRLTQDYRDEKVIVERIKGISRQIIEKKKSAIMTDIKNQAAIEEDKKKPFLDLLLAHNLKNEFSQEELEDELNTFLLAGTDTNATSSCFVLTLLAMHPEIQEKLYEEVMETVGPDKPIELEDLPKLRYTECVIKESLRLFPGAPFAARVVNEDVVLDDETIIPKGSHAILGYLVLQRNQKYWPDPLRFDPDRFLPENAGNIHPYSWLPFSGGPRNCIGIKYAMMVMKTMIPTIIRKFRVGTGFTKIEDIEVTANIVMKPKGGFDLSLEVR